MTLDEERRMKMLEGTLREIRRIAKEVEKDNLSVSFDDALEGKLLKAWNKVARQIDMLLP